MIGDCVSILWFSGADTVEGLRNTILDSDCAFTLNLSSKSAHCLSATRAFACETHTLARGACADAFASRLRGDAKDGRSVAIRVDAIGVAGAIFAETGRPGTRFSRESGHWPPTTLSNIEKSVSAPRRLSTMTCLAPSRAKNSGMKPPGADSNRLVSALPGDVAAVGGNVASSFCRSNRRQSPTPNSSEIKTLKSGIIGSLLWQF